MYTGLLLLQQMTIQLAYIMLTLSNLECLSILQVGASSGLGLRRWHSPDNGQCGGIPQSTPLTWGRNGVNFHFFPFDRVFL